MAAARLPKRRAGHWLLATAGAFSIFLAGVILLLPHPATAAMAWALAGYAFAFGVLTILTAGVFREVYGAPGDQEQAPRSTRRA